MYQVRKIDVAVVITAVALLLPLAFDWAMYLGPLLAVFGTIAFCSLVIVRTSQSLMRSYLPEPQRTRVTSVQSVSLHRERIMQAQPRIAGAALPPPKSWLGQWIQGMQDKWGEAWESRRHGVVLLCAAIYICVPVDLCPEIPFGPLGLIDDGFAFVLGAKHFFDLFKRDVASAHTSMVGAIERAKERDALPDDNVIDADFSVRDQV